jgi:hypothetical protein
MKTYSVVASDVGCATSILRDDDPNVPPLTLVTFLARGMLLANDAAVFVEVAFRPNDAERLGKELLELSKTVPSVEAQLESAIAAAAAIKSINNPEGTTNS